MGDADRYLTRELRRALRDPWGMRQEALAELLDGTELPRGALPDDRASGRLGVYLDATLLAREKRGRRWPARITDVSLSGLGAELDGRPPEPGPVLVEMRLPTPGECHLMPGRISWVEEARSGVHAGVTLTDECAHAWFVALLRIVSTASAPTTR